MRALLRGESVDIPQYDFTTSSRVSSTTRVSPGAVIIIEGIFVLLPELRHLFDTIIYIETKLDACLERKIRRDIQSRGRTEAEVRQQSQGDPGFFENYIHAYKGHAGILIDNSTFCNDLDFNMGPIIQEVKSRMDARETYLGTLFMSDSKFSLFTQSPLNPEAIKLNGFVELKNGNFLKKDYTELYKQFDVFIDAMRHQNLSEPIYEAEEKFLLLAGQKDRYCSTPPSYRTPGVHTQKRFQKTYFQFIKEHYQFLQSCYPGLLLTHCNALDFLKYMSIIDQISKLYFNLIIDKIETQYPGTKKLMYGRHNELTVVTKIVKYDKTDTWGTSPHVDKSGFTLIWDADDDQESLLICENTSNPSISALKRPLRMFSNQRDATSAILIPGACLSKVGINIKPTIHAVAPFMQSSRHAVVSFALIPDIDTSDIETDFVENSLSNHG